jgi:YD repeat-containing protein
MKKIILLVTMISVMVFQSIAQKVDLDRYNFTFEYRDLPLKPMSAELQSYSVRLLKVPERLTKSFASGELDQMILIDGWKRKDPPRGLVTVEIIINDFAFTEAKVTERVQVLTDNTGKETGRRSFYKMDAVYQCDGSVVLKNHKDEEINKINFGSDHYAWSSDEFSTSAEASSFYNDNRYKLGTEIFIAQTKSNLRAVTNWLNENYGYPTRKDDDFFWIMDSKKHPENAAQQEAWSKFKSAVATITADAMSEDARKQFNELIQYFDGIPAKFASDDKGDKKLRYGSYFNKGKIYLYLDNPEAAVKEADKLIANGYDESDGKLIKTRADALVEKLKVNNTTTRHFTIDLNKPEPAPAGLPVKTQKFRVQKIKESHYDAAFGTNPSRTAERELIYEADGSLSTIKEVLDGKDINLSYYLYMPNEVVIKNKDFKIEKTYTYSSSVLKNYLADRSNTLEFELSNGKPMLMTHFDRCSKTTKVYQMEYDAKGKTAAWKETVKEVGPKSVTIYKVVYDNTGKITRLDRTDAAGTVLTSYALERTGNNVTKVTHTVQGKPNERYEFDYDANGNITEQRIFNIREGKNFKHTVYNISYSEANGNDYLLWDNNNWLFNYLLGLRTYQDESFLCTRDY